jgi:hypothetical protein
VSNYQDVKLGGMGFLQRELRAVSSMRWYQLGIEEHGARAAALAGSTHKPGDAGFVGGKGVRADLKRWALTVKQYGDEGNQYSQREYNNILAAERDARKKARGWK